MQIHMECPKCMNACAAPAESVGQEFACPHCRGDLPATDVLVVETPSEPRGAGIDVEVLLGLSALALIVVTAALFFTHFHA